MIVPQKDFGRGLTGLQGSLYCGTGCFHRRKVTYGLSPDEEQTQGRNMSLINEYEALRTKLRNSRELMESAGRVLFAMDKNTGHPKDISKAVKTAVLVAACYYESDTQWGKQVGWVCNQIVSCRLATC
ncbi:hypothetical protein NE237_000986 [Protea cynaroides]|uniref:Uncharacterized protein n=1 Tax=Protea cynaroides TaxID=273540 RepID=A0A9Q0QXN3_9MAGN|nr:hypothetical protein NE237_000986 [Protea cynaroides]